MLSSEGGALADDLGSLLATILDSPPFQQARRRAAALGWPGDRSVVTRFAPSPTGELHLGHVLHALWVWSAARLFNARVVVRMEDHDRSRCRPEFEASILDDLDWLGLEPDSVSRDSLRRQPSPWRQSDVPERYVRAMERLRAVTDVYPCTCTRADLEPVEDGGERRYPGTCRGRRDETTERHVLRARLPAGEIATTDLVFGVTVSRPDAEFGDPVVRDALGQWTYQLAVVVDDLEHGVDLVVRGEDLRSSTGRQAVLAGMLGRAEPIITVHHPLLYAEDGRKLSKRDRSETVRARRERGETAIEVMREAWERSIIGKR